MFAYQFPPMGGAGVQKVTKFVKYLPAYGWKPWVLTIKGRGTAYVNRDSSLMSEISPETEMIRTPSWQPESLIWGMQRHRATRLLKRALLIPDEHIPWLLSAVPVGVRLVREHHIDVIYSTDPPSTHVIACLVKRITGRPWVCDFRDLWTQNFTYRPVSFLHGLADSWLERQVLLNADGIIANTDGYRSVFSRQYPQVAGKIRVISNGFDSDDFQGLVAEQRSDKFTITYVGELYDFAVRPRPQGWRRLLEPFVSGPGPAVLVRTPRYLFQALRSLLDEHPELDGQIQVVFVGRFPEASRQAVEQLGLGQIVKATGYLPHREAIRFLLGADVLLAMQAGEGSQVVIPGKIYEYLKAGRAILGLFPEGETPRLIRQAKAGCVLPPDDVEGIKQQLWQWIQMRQAGKPLVTPDWSVIGRYERKLLTERLAQFLEQICLKRSDFV